MIKHTQGIGFLVVVILTTSFVYKYLIDGSTENVEVFVPEIEKIMKEHSIETVPEASIVAINPTGAYLSSYFAQNRNDWDSANNFLQAVLENDQDNIELIKRSMILAVGESDLETAALHAQRLYDEGDQESLILLVLALHEAKSSNYKPALDKIKAMPDDEMTSFIKPLLLGWVEAGADEAYVPKITAADKTTIHTYHKALIAFYLGQNDKVIELIEETLQYPNVTVLESDRLADLYALLGHKEKAGKIYSMILDRLPAYSFAQKKKDALDGDDQDLIKQYLEPVTSIDSISAGIAQALYDMSFILYQERSMTSTRIFGSMALMMDQDHIATLGLLAETLVTFERSDDAIELFNRIPKSYHKYINTQRRVADVLIESERYEEAENVLNTIYSEYDDVEALIKIGDIYRQKEEYAKALEIYNEAAEDIGSPLPEKYWFLLYARGMVYEREGQWEKAEADLLAALDYQPDHPYLMNYIGYGWADRGMNLDRSLELIRNALKLLPRDGYITDSLGWVYYMSGQYKKAVPYLEQAVELLPYDATINDHLGDAYWRVGRRIEARFQWERARNNIKNEEGLLDKLTEKLEHGLLEDHVTKFSQTSEDEK